MAKGKQEEQAVTQQSAYLGPIKIPTTHKRRQFIYYLEGNPIIENEKWAVAVFDVKTLGRHEAWAVAKYEWVDGIGYDRPEWHFPDSYEEALALVLELTGDPATEDF